MKIIGYARMRYDGPDEYMGYRHGEEYALKFLEADFLDRVLNKYSFWIEDTNGNGYLYPYKSIVTFLMNWVNV